MKFLQGFSYSSLVIVFSLFTQVYANEQQKQGKEFYARECLKAMKLDEILREGLRKKIAHQKSVDTGKSKEFFDALEEFANEAGLFELLVSIYAKYLSEEELKELTQFFRSPIGIKTLPAFRLAVQGNEFAPEDLGLTETDINEFLEFFGTPTGKSILEKMPDIANETAKAGKIYMERVYEQIEERSIHKEN